jgi:hypothetical protein
MKGQKALILTIAFAVVLLAVASFIVVSSVNELTSSGGCTAQVKVKVWQGDIEFSHQCVRSVAINPPYVARPKAIKPKPGPRNP